MLALKTAWVVCLCLACLSACRRDSTPGAGQVPSSQPGASPAPALAPSSASAALAPPDKVRSAHDLPDEPAIPARPPSDHAVEIKASHILIAYQGARGAGPGVTRSREEAKGLANHVDIQARAGADFEQLVLKYSDDPQARSNRGNLGKFGRAQFDKAFSDAAFELMKQEIAIEPVETDSGFHIIKRTE